jgi:hypothetical protein
MRGKVTAKASETKFGEFEETHHILPEFAKIATGKWKPTYLDQERMLKHLSNCLYCQNSIGAFVNTILDGTSESSSKDPTRKVLMRLKDALHKIRVQEEYIAAYAEILETYGVEEANNRFPVLAEHLKHCEDCKSEVEDMRGVLRQAELAGLIEPLREDAKTEA